MRILALILLVVPACSPAKPPAASAPAKTYIRRLSLPGGGAGTIECDTGRWHGTIEIAANVEVGYQSTSTTTSPAGTVTKTTITANGRECVIEETGLRIGEKTVGPLSGDVHVEIRADGVFVNGTKAADL